MFHEILSLPGNLRPIGQTRIESPTEGSVQNRDAVNLIFYPDPDADEVQIYQDVENPQLGSAWDLVEKRDIAKTSSRIELTREFRKKGAQGNRIRAIKLVSRTQDGVILSSRVVRFRTTD